MIAGVVGTLLLAINQGDVLLGAECPGALVWKARSPTSCPSSSRRGARS